MLGFADAAPAADRQAAHDPLVSVNVAVISVVTAGLLLAGVLAVYDWKTPGAEGPLAVVLAALTVALLGLDILVLSVRHLHRLRLGR